MHQNNNQMPMMFVFAGNNGSGKSTLRNLLIDKLGTEINIDPDAIARRLHPNNPESKRFSAGKEAIKMVYECINQRMSFSIETTLSGKNAIRQMEKAKENGFEISLFYIGLRHVNQNIERVALRVKNGGHYISTEDILKRNITSPKNLLEYISIIDHLVVIDNSRANGEIILEASDGVITFISNNLPQWVLPIKEKFKN